MKRARGPKTPPLPAPVLSIDVEEDAPDAGEEEESDDDDVPPRVVVTTLGEVAAWMTPDVARGFGDRPVWFLLEEDAELVGLFDRIPEDPMSKGRVAAILRGLRAFAAERSDALQALLGVSDGIGVGFHVDAPMARVKASFEEDGFELVGTVEAGVVTEA